MTARRAGRVRHHADLDDPGDAEGGRREGGRDAGCAEKRWPDGTLGWQRACQCGGEEQAGTSAHRGGSGCFCRWWIETTPTEAQEADPVCNGIGSGTPGRRPGDPVPAASGAVASLIASVHSELRALAAHYLRRERPDHTLPPTTLVNEACRRNVGLDGQIGLGVCTRVWTSAEPDPGTDRADGTAARKRGKGRGRVLGQHTSGSSRTTRWAAQLLLPERRAA
ncbi:MAG: hypothetical protein IPK26_02610 [Planctomycetes bacterium]|nr:hypothetical protein [Planctomycetota bacterium]